MLSHRHRARFVLVFQPMSAIDNMLDAIQRSRDERNSDMPDEEPSEFGQEPDGQAEIDNEPMAGFQNYSAAG